MARLLLVRHGLTDHNVDRRVAGYTDVSLNEEGLQQVEKLNGRLADEKIDAVYSSDLQRAVDTAKGSVSGRDIEVVTCYELREMNFGEAEEMTFTEMNEKYPDLARSVMNVDSGLSFPGGESFADFVERVREFLKRLEKFNEDHTVLVVSHGATLRVIICELLGIDPNHWYQLGIDNASLSVVNTYGHRTILNSLNEISFLND
ncbi:MAG: histidine phosphatase family protein [Dehalococcoidales bacterium]|nr:MAG: histidine phosphatase family protein [Dehalococcoidales bacterium]